MSASPTVWAPKLYGQLFSGRDFFDYGAYELGVELVSAFWCWAASYRLM